jgi:hypothetical protein
MNTEIFKNAPKAKLRRDRDEYKGRKIVDVELDGIDHRDAPDYCDTYITRAVWEDTGEDLTDSELDDLNGDRDFVYEKLMQKLY